jgi:Flp pilus assembly protein TadG
MQERIHHLYRDERGMSFVYVGMGFLGFLAASTLAIDVGMFMTAKAQTQNAADAGALGGAVALVQNSFTDRSGSGPAVLSAINTAQANKIMGGVPSVLTGDVTFPAGPTGQSNRVHVEVYRTAARGNGVPTLMGSLLGVRTVNLTASATAEASPANAMKCVKPFMIPDKWTEKQTPGWDPNDSFDMFTNKGVPLANPDIYIGAQNKSSYTGYTVANDKGTVLVLRAGTGDNIKPSFYYSWKMPGDTGGDFYRENIANCNQSTMRWNDTIIQEPGDKTGPTIQGIDMLIAKDPNAYWDTGCTCVKGSAYGVSPRVFPIPLYDPEYYATGRANGRVADFRIANFLGFFVDHTAGNSIWGRITNVTGLVDPDAGPAPEGAFPTAIRLVQ